MRVSWLGILIAMTACSALARDGVVEIHASRPFGYFVGDVIRARVDVHGSATTSLLRASLPKPGSLTPYLDLIDCRVEESDDSEGKVWRLFLTYQNFYVALDVRDIVIPAIALNLSENGSVREMEIPSWKVGVAPLREVMPEAKERAEDYLRPDGAALYHSDFAARYTTVAFGVLALLGIAFVARDRAWFPFQRRRLRRFSSLARRLRVKRREPKNLEALRAALLELHRTLDAAYGKTLLEANLGGFLDQHAHFAPLAESFGRFFSVSREVFFGRRTAAVETDCDWLASFIIELAKRERAA